LTNHKNADSAPWQRGRISLNRAFGLVDLHRPETFYSFRVGGFGRTVAYERPEPLNAADRPEDRSFVSVPSGLVLSETAGVRQGRCRDRAFSEIEAQPEYGLNASIVCLVPASPVPSAD